MRSVEEEEEEDEDARLDPHAVSTGGAQLFSAAPIFEKDKSSHVRHSSSGG